MRAHVFGSAVLLCFLVAAAAASLDVVRCPVDCATQPDIGNAVNDCLLISRHWNANAVVVQLTGDACNVSTFNVPAVSQVMYEGPATVVGSGLRIHPNVRISVIFKDLLFDGKDTKESLLASPDVCANLTFVRVRFTGFTGQSILHVKGVNYIPWLRAYSSRVDSPTKPPPIDVSDVRIIGWPFCGWREAPNWEICIQLSEDAGDFEISPDDDVISAGFDGAADCVVDSRATLDDTPGFGLFMFDTIEGALAGCTGTIMEVRHPKLMRDYKQSASE